MNGNTRTVKLALMVGQIAQALAEQYESAADDEGFRKLLVDFHVPQIQRLCLEIEEANKADDFPDGCELTREEWSVAKKRRIEAIKMIRERANLPLKEAKDMVDKWVPRT